MTLEELKTKEGQILCHQGDRTLWMFKFLSIDYIYNDNNRVNLNTTLGLDIYPSVRFYMSPPNKNHKETLRLDRIIIPTKEQLNLYRNETRKVRILNRC